MATEKLLTLAQLQDELAKVLPDRPCRRTLYVWMESATNPMPFIPKPATGKGTSRRTGRWFRLTAVLAWLEAPERKAG